MNTINTIKRRKVVLIGGRALELYMVGYALAFSRFG